jgi:hypothetical protein
VAFAGNLVRHTAVAQPWPHRRSGDGGRADLLAIRRRISRRNRIGAAARASPGDTGGGRSPDPKLFPPYLRLISRDTRARSTISFYELSRRMSAALHRSALRRRRSSTCSVSVCWRTRASAAPRDPRPLERRHGQIRERRNIAIFARRVRVASLAVPRVVDRGPLGRHRAGLLVVLSDEPRRVVNASSTEDAAVLVGVGLSGRHRADEGVRKDRVVLPARMCSWP